MDLETKSKCLVSTWNKSLKCCVCLDYFKHPHTLRCGHSFCKSCLAHLACVTRQQSLHIGVRKLKIVCPTCRQPQPALPYLKRKVSTNFTLQEIVQSWLLQHEVDKGSSSVVTVRSVSTQSDILTPLGLIPNKYSSTSIIAKEEYSEMPSRKLSFYFDIDTERSNNNEGLHSHATCSWCNGFQDDPEESSGSEDTADELEDHQRNTLRLVEIVRFALLDLREALYEMLVTPGRIMMAMVWSGYTVSVLVIANGFLPYMLLYSLLFILILYAETLEQRRMRMQLQ